MMTPFQFRMAIEETMLDLLPDTPPIRSLLPEEVDKLRWAFDSILTQAKSAEQYKPEPRALPRIEPTPVLKSTEPGKQAALFKGS